MLKSQGVLLHFNTNGLHLDDEMISKIIESGIDSIKFSFQGIDELTYGGNEERWKLYAIA